VNEIADLSAADLLAW